MIWIICIIVLWLLYISGLRSPYYNTRIEKENIELLRIKNSAIQYFIRRSKSRNELSALKDHLFPQVRKQFGRTVSDKLITEVMLELWSSYFNKFHELPDTTIKPKHDELRTPAGSDTIQ